MPKAPSERELSSECETEGECAHNKKEQILKLRRLLPPLTRSPVSLRFGHARVLICPRPYHSFLSRRFATLLAPKQLFSSRVR